MANYLSIQNNYSNSWRSTTTQAAKAKSTMPSSQTAHPAAQSPSAPSQTPSAGSVGKEHFSSPDGKVILKGWSYSEEENEKEEKNSSIEKEEKHLPMEEEEKKFPIEEEEKKFPIEEKEKRFPIGEEEEEKKKLPFEEEKEEKEKKSQDCQTCKNRKYQDGSNEMVSFKSPAHIAPEAAGIAVRSHEQEHVSNAYSKAAKNHGKVISANVSIHMAICPECGRSYVSGGTTHTQIKYYNEENPYQQDLKLGDKTKYTGMNVNYSL